MSTVPAIFINLADAPVQFDSWAPGNDNDPDYTTNPIPAGASFVFALDVTHTRIGVSAGDIHKRIDFSEHLGRPVVIVASGAAGNTITVVQIVVPQPEISAVAVSV